jgi:hypothetical protein
VSVALPGPDEVDLRPPGPAEVQATALGVAAMVAGPPGLTRLQRLLIEALFVSMTGHPVDLGNAAPTMSVRQVAEGLARRNLAFRSRIVQLMVLCALVLRPLPATVVARIEGCARELGVDEDMLAVARGFAEGSLGLAAADFERNGYSATWSDLDAQVVHVSGDLEAPWDVAVRDPALAERWDALGDLGPGSLGRAVWEMYRARGFEFPGRPGSAPPLLAQHDWVHVLADYGTTVESEIEVFGLIARANDDMRAFSLLAMVVSLFETGYLRTGAGLFESTTGHLAANPGLATRLGDAMRRGALARDTETGSDSVDFLRFDWFSVAGLEVAEVRRRFSLVPKAPSAVAAGSVGPWERGGISPFQLAAGRTLAERQGRPYDAHGASVAGSEAPD